MMDEFCVKLDGRFGYKRVRIFPSRGLGVGSYGSVYTAVLDELPCAVKVLHSIFGTRDPGAGNLTARFEQECRFLSDLKHPRLVQLLGHAHDPRSACPILLMELMDESLTQFLKRQTCCLPLHVQVNLTHDVTLALAYLHSNEIVHRNLTSNNVLVAGSRAKVTDFGMSKMADINPRMISITLSPENKPFMPPEIFLLDPSYSDKVDIFSAGVLTIQTITRKFPAPTKSKCIANFSASPTGVIEVPVPEKERRNNDISQISPTHPLLPVAFDCLKDKDGDRPSAGQLCQRLAALKEDPSYAESMQGRVEGAAGQGNISTSTSLEKKRRHSGELRGQPQQEKLRLRERRYSYEPQKKKVCQWETLQQLAEKDKVIQRNDEMIRAKDEEIRVKDQEIGAKNAEVRYRIQEIAQLQKNLEMRDEEVANVTQLVEEKKEAIPSEESNSVFNLPLVPKNKVNIQWEVKMNAPEKMGPGTAVVCGNTVYCMAYSSNVIHGYLVEEDQWKIKLNFPRCYAALTIIRRLLTGVGGSNSNQLTSWKVNGWEEVFPPMNATRSSPRVVSNGDHIIVVGGFTQFNSVCSSIEVFTIPSGTWATTVSMTTDSMSCFPRSILTTTLCGDRLFVTSSMCLHSISIEDVVPSDNLTTPSKLSTKSKRRKHIRIPVSSSTLSTIGDQVVATKSKWREHIRIPVSSSTLSTIGDQVVVVGGGSKGDVYELESWQWVKVGCMQYARDDPIVAVLYGNRMLAVGGSKPDPTLAFRFGSEQLPSSEAVELAVLF